MNKVNQIKQLIKNPYAIKDSKKYLDEDCNKLTNIVRSNKMEDCGNYSTEINIKPSDIATTQYVEDSSTTF